MRFDKEALFWDEKPRRVELAKAVANYIQPYCFDKKVLDFGCGTGLVSLNLEAKEILGVDLSCEMVNIFNQKAQKFSINAKAVCEDIKNIDTKFDVIVANMVFHHIKDVNNYVNILKSKLNKGGKIFISDLFLEDGTFHDKGNDDVYHFGFSKDSFNCIKCEKIYTIKKHKEFDVYIWSIE